MEKIKQEKRFLFLSMLISISGFSQGLLLPLLAVMLEKEGVSSSMNGVNAMALYIGMLIASPFMEKPVRRFGYKPIIIIGIVMLAVSIALFPIWINFYFWILLRFIVGIADSAIHYTTQVWITSDAPKEKRGRIISLYGLSYGIGFGIGPLGLMLLSYGVWVPFISALALIILSLFLVFGLKNDWPDTVTTDSQTVRRYPKVIGLAGIAFIPMFIYGFLESTLNASFPIYGLRTGIEENYVSMLLSSFVIGSLIFQLPLGALSDYIGRKRVLVSVTLIGGLLFGLVPYMTSLYQLLIIFIVAGGLVGSLFSLGLAYVADILPKELLPTANIIAGILFGIGSLIGPFAGGAAIDVNPHSLFYVIFIVVTSFSVISLTIYLSKRFFGKKIQATD